MVKLRDPLSQVLDDAEEHEADSLVDVSDLLVVRALVVAKKPRRRVVRRRKK